jgi:integrase
MADATKVIGAGGGRPIHRLNALKVARERKPGLHADGGGLYLLVGRSGARSWIYRYRQGRKLHDMGLGPLHTVRLAEARDKALACRKQRLEGIDPLAARRAQKQQAQLERAKAMTFKQCAEAYIANNRGTWKNPKHAAQWPSTLATYVYPIFGDLPVQAIDTALVLKVLEQPVEGAANDDDKRLWWAKTETASRVRQRIEAVLDWARVKGYRDRDSENPARWHGHLEHSLPKKTKVRPVKNHAAMPYKELPAFMAELRNRRGISARALEFTILTVMRTDAVIGAAADEIEERVWTVPAARMKGEQRKAEPKDFRVPMSAPALAIAEHMQREHGNGFLFPGGDKPGKHLSNMAMLKLLKEDIGLALTVHGFRATFKTWASHETDFPREVIEAAMAHAIDSKVEEAYQRGDFFEKRRRLMEAWARYCTERPANA